MRKTYKYKLKPIPQQERELGRVLGLCRHLYNTALEQRIIAYRRAGISLSRYQQEADYQQEAELKDIRAGFPEYAAIHSHIFSSRARTSCRICEWMLSHTLAVQRAGL